MRTPRLISLTCFFVLSVLSTTLAAAPDGRTLFAQGAGTSVPACTTCHGADATGGAGGQYPSLAGLPATYVQTQLKAFANGNRTNPIMAPIAKGLSTDDMRSLGRYLAGLTSVHRAAPTADAATLAAGQALVTIGNMAHGTPACTSCHGRALAGGGPQIPPLTGQWAAYLATQLTAFHDGSRHGGPQNLMGAVARKLSAQDIHAVATYIASLRVGEKPQIPRDAKTARKPAPQAPDSFVPPPEQAMPTAGDYGKVLALGERIFDNTPKYASEFVGNQLSCSNCHLARGRDPDSAPLWAAIPQYPKYRGKNKRVNTFAMRLQGCFVYSENGKPPPADSDVMVALITYAHWLATGLPTGIKPAAAGYPKLAGPAQTPSRERGAKVFQAHCAMCHGADGQGRVVAGARVFPALWGPDSFNWGAGMHRVNTAAAFIKANMPLGAGGSLSDQQAWDVAAFVDSHPRPQDPRFKGNTEATRKAFHAKHPYGFYGRTVDGKQLGGPGD